MGVIVFHVPFELAETPGAGSSVRPVKILEALKSLGQEVAVIAGKPKERARDIRALKKKIRAGLEIDFVYSEASSSPTILKDKYQSLIRPFMEARFFRLLHKREIRIGLFYRDVYWQFDDFLRGVFAPIRWLYRMSYYYDLLIYKRYISILYMPSDLQGKYIPIFPKTKMKELPPGAPSGNTDFVDNQTLFYVGGLGGHYQMHKTVAAIASLKESGTEAIICTTKEYFDEMKDQYPEISSSNIRIVHQKGEELAQTYKEISIGLLLMKPDPYREFAIPIKLFEYIGNGKPIIATQGTAASKIIEQHDLGWTVPYEDSAIRELLSSPLIVEQLYEKHLNVLKYRDSNSWHQRAVQIRTDLTRHI